MEFDAFNLSFKIFKGTGLWSDENSTWINYLYGVFMHLSLIDSFGNLLKISFKLLSQPLKFSVILQTIYLFTSDDVETISKVFNIYLTYLGLLFKTINFAFKFKKIIALKSSLNELITFGKFDEKSDRFLKGVKRGYKCYKALLFSAWIRFEKLEEKWERFALIFYSSVLMAGLQSFITHELAFPIIKKNLLDTEFKYYTAALYDTVNPAIASSINLSLDCLPVFFMSYAIAIVNELSIRLEKIGEKTQNAGSESRESERCHLNELIECVNIHLKVKELTRNIEQHFSTIILVQGLMSSIIFCTCIYVLSLVNHKQI